MGAQPGAYHQQTKSLNPVKKLWIVLTVIFAANTAFGQRHTTDAAIDKVLNNFMQSIIKKDTAALSSLFAVGVPIGWLDVQGKATLEFSRKTDPNVKVLEADTHTGFIKYIGTTKNAVEEKFYNVKLRSNGLLATLSFDYSFWLNKKKINWGQENWELVFDGEGWKIAGVYFSYELEAVKAEPKRIVN